MGGGITEVSLAQVVLKTGLDMLILSFSGRGGLLSELCHYLSKEDKKKNRRDL